MTIAEVADFLGQQVCEKAGRQEDLKRVCYGTEVFLTLSISLLVILLIGAILGMFSEVAAVSIMLLLTKTVVGGPHLSGYARCAGFSMLLIVGSAWLFSRLMLSPVMILGLTFVSLVIVVCWAPRSKLPDMYSENQTWARKLIALALLAGLGCLAAFSHHELWGYLFLGSFLSIWSISPVGTEVVKTVEKITKGVERE